MMSLRAVNVELLARWMGSDQALFIADNVHHEKHATTADQKGEQAAQTGERCCVRQTLEAFFAR